MEDTADESDYDQSYGVWQPDPFDGHGDGGCHHQQYHEHINVKAVMHAPIVPSAQASLIEDDNQLSCDVE
jgi:hypothetical protein